MANTIASFDGELLRLIEKGSNNVKVKSIIQKEELFNSTDASKNTLLHTAAQNNAEITRYLIESGSKVDAQNKHGRTPLMLAVEEDCEETETAEVLLDAGANIELQDDLGQSALHVIAESHYYLLRWKLLELFWQKLKIDCFDNKEEIAKKLIASQWALQHVVQLKDSGLTRIVLQRGYAAEIDAFDRYDHTALHLAVLACDVENVKALLEYNANVNIVDKADSRLPVSDVYGRDDDYPNERLEILKMLLEAGAVIGGDIVDDYDRYEIFEYADKGGIKLLFQHNVDRSAGCDQHAVLLKLVENRNPGTIEEIHGRGFDVNARDDYSGGPTPLMQAAASGNTRAVEFLLNEGADINAVDHINYTAIFYAIDGYPGKFSKYEPTSCVQLLLERGADAQYENVRKTILHLILRKKLFSLGELVVAHLALQEILGMSITETTRKGINSCDQFKTYFESSKQQLSKKVYESTTLFDLLTVVTDEKLEMYACNDEFVLKCQDTIDTLSGHIYFSTILQKRLSNAMAIVALKTGAAQVISKIMGTSYDGFPLVADRITRTLDYEDMENLKNSLK